MPVGFLSWMGQRQTAADAKRGESKRRAASKRARAARKTNRRG